MELNQSINQQSLSERVEQALKEEILSGRLAPEQRIDLNAYSADWSISTTPLRDAVRQLESVGLVEVSPRRGVFVSRLDRKALKELFDLRIALESKAIELATIRMPIEEARNAQMLYAQVRSATRKSERDELLSQIDLLVHELGIRHCGNARLIKIMDGLADLVCWSQRTVIRNLNESYEMTLLEHLHIIEAVCARDASAASAAMREHLQNTSQRIEVFLMAQSLTEARKTNSKRNRRVSL